MTEAVLQTQPLTKEASTLGNTAHTQAILGALATMGQFAAQHRTQRHALAVEELRTAEMAHLVDALVTRRVAEVKEGFVAVLFGYAEQARHFMDQQRGFAEAEIASRDPLRRIELRSRVHKIDAELATIRLDAQMLFARMTDVILALGGTPGDFARELTVPLALAAPSGGEHG